MSEAQYLRRGSSDGPQEKKNKAVSTGFRGVFFLMLMMLPKYVGFGYSFVARGYRYALTAHAVIRRLYLEDAFPSAMESLLLRAARDDGVVVHVGASVGVLALASASSVGERGCVIAYEANPYTFKALATNVSLNPRYGGVISLRNIAVSDQRGERYSTNFPMHFRDFVTEAALPKTSKVQSTTLDNEILPPYIDLLLVTAPGQEVSVLEGAHDTLKKVHSVVISLDTNSRSQVENPLVRILFSLEYKKFYTFLVEGSSLYYLDRTKELPTGEMIILAHRAPERFADTFGYTIKVKRMK